MHLLKSEDLTNLLKNYLNDLPDLVFVNSCHSEKIGQAFFDIGVKSVIMIDSEDMISDEAAQMFS